ncbi:MAG TPA: hypothetical protein VI750_11210 [Pyrinomonadaceae bacterium]|nr:hypothetical protein [Pyrinomonadaceae bacterium]
MYSEAISLSENVLRTESENQDFLQIVGYAYAKEGRRRDIEDTIRKFDEIAKTHYMVAYRVGMLYAMLGDKERAFVEIEKSFAPRDWDINRIKVDPFIDSLRDDPRFADLVKRIGLPK